MSARAKGVLFLGVVLCLLAVGWSYLQRRGQETTDDVQIEGRIVHVSARIAGEVRRVHVSDYQLVEAGTLLVELDDREVRARVSAARADLQMAQASLRGAMAQMQLSHKGARAGMLQARGGIDQALGGVDAAGAQVGQAEAEVQSGELRLAQNKHDFERGLKLHQEGAFPKADLELRQLAYEQARRQLDLAAARLRSAKAASISAQGAVTVAKGRLRAARTERVQAEAAAAQVALAEAKVEQSKAALQLVELQATYTQIRAPVRGVVSRRNVELGALVSPDRLLVALAVPDEVWALAYFKEDQLGKAKVGQRALLRIDGYAGRAVPARVRALGAATGSRFSLLPPDNASGNFIKVTQRIPVLLDLQVPKDLSLRIGMSATATLFEP